MKSELNTKDIIETVAQFGTGRLVKTKTGLYEFVGGTRQDLLEALEWTAMFSPELVFIDAR